MRYAHTYAKINMKEEEPEKPSIHVRKKVMHIIPSEQNPKHEKELCVPDDNEKCPLCDKPYEEKKCSKKHMYCMTNRKYTEDRVPNCVYDSYYDAHIPISEQKSTVDYLKVEQMRKEIREYQLGDRSGCNNTYSQLEIFMRKVSLFYPTMLTERHKEFQDFVVYSYSSVKLEQGYEFKGVNIPWQELLILNKIKV